MAEYYRTVFTIEDGDQSGMGLLTCVEASVREWGGGSDRAPNRRFVGDMGGERTEPEGRSAAREEHGIFLDGV